MSGVRGTPAASALRVAYVAYAFPVLTQTFTSWEVAGLARAGLDLHVFAVRQGRDAERAENGAEAPPVTYLPGPFSAAALGALLRWLVRRPWRTSCTLLACLGGRYRDRAFRSRLAAPLHALQGLLLASRVERGGFGRVHAQFVDAGSTVGFVASRLADVPFSFTNHTAYNPFLLSLKARHADLVISISEFDRRRVVEACPAAAARCHVVRVGAPLERWRGAPRSPEQGRILSVGALREKKGHDVLLRAAARLRDAGVPCCVAIAGGGEEEGALRALAAELELEVEFLGPVSPQRVSTELRRAEVFCLACRVARNGDLDGVPVSVMEAMAMGLPVVSTTLSGLPELIEDGESGLLAVPGDSASLAAALQRVLQDAGLRERLGRRATARVAALHDLDTCCRRTADLFRARADASATA